MVMPSMLKLNTGHSTTQEIGVHHDADYCDKSLESDVHRRCRCTNRNVNTSRLVVISGLMYTRLIMPVRVRIVLSHNASCISKSWYAPSPDQQMFP